MAIPRALKLGKNKAGQAEAAKGTADSAQPPASAVNKTASTVAPGKGLAGASAKAPPSNVPATAKSAASSPAKAAAPTSGEPVSKVDSGKSQSSQSRSRKSRFPFGKGQAPPVPPVPAEHAEAARGGDSTKAPNAPTTPATPATTPPSHGRSQSLDLRRRLRMPSGMSLNKQNRMFRRKGANEGAGGAATAEAQPTSPSASAKPAKSVPTTPSAASRNVAQTPVNKGKGKEPAQAPAAAPVATPRSTNTTPAPKLAPLVPSSRMPDAAVAPSPSLTPMTPGPAQRSVTSPPTSGAAQSLPTSPTGAAPSILGAGLNVKSSQFIRPPEMGAATPRVVPSAGPLSYLTPSHSTAPNDLADVSDATVFARSDVIEPPKASTPALVYDDGECEAYEDEDDEDDMMTVESAGITLPMHDAPEYMEAPADSDAHGDGVSVVPSSLAHTRMPGYVPSDFGHDGFFATPQGKSSYVLEPAAEVAESSHDGDDTPLFLRSGVSAQGQDSDLDDAQDHASFMRKHIVSEEASPDHTRLLEQEASAEREAMERRVAKGKQPVRGSEEHEGPDLDEAPHSVEPAELSVGAEPFADAEQADPVPPREQRKEPESHHSLLESLSLGVLASASRSLFGSRRPSEEPMAESDAAPAEPPHDEPRGKHAELAASNEQPEAPASPKPCLLYTSPSPRDS